MVTDEQAGTLLRALANPVRREIFQMVSAASMRVGDVTSCFEVSRPAISRHLRVLREAGLVEERRKGRERWLSAASGPLERLGEWCRRWPESSAPAAARPTNRSEREGRSSGEEVGEAGPSEFAEDAPAGRHWKTW